MSLPGFIPHVWSRIASRTFLTLLMTAGLPLTHRPGTWESDPPPKGPSDSFLCGAGFGTLTRLQWHTDGVHPPGSPHSSSLGLLPRIKGSYVVYDPESRAVHLCGLARFPVSGGNKPTSTYAEACTTFLALFHARRVLHPDHTYSTPTDSHFPRCMAGINQAVT